MEILLPQWTAPAGIFAGSTTRTGGVSAAPWASLNLGSHVDDVPDHVRENRRRLSAQAAMPSSPVWLEQVHGIDVLHLDATPPVNVRADAAYTGESCVVCTVMTADCLPVLFCSRDGKEVAAAHAGWRGLSAGVLEATLACFRSPVEEIIAWMGPAIGPDAFEVGAEVRNSFVGQHSSDADAFTPSGDKYYADIWLLARARLRRAGVHFVSGGGYCTFTDEERFFSYRREGITGRMASFIWRQ